MIDFRAVSCCFLAQYNNDQKHFARKVINDLCIRFHADHKFAYCKLEERCRGEKVAEVTGVNQGDEILA